MANAVAVPPLRPGDCQIWWVSARAAAPPLARLLDESEQERLSRFLREEDRALYLVSHALQRLVLAAYLGIPAPQVRFSRVCRHCGAMHGKPQLENGMGALEFSLSHSGSQAALAVSRAVPLGVDVEQVKPDRDRAGLISMVLSEAEQQAIGRLPQDRQGLAFLRYWTRKEALLKATGHGLAVAPHSITVTAHDEAAALVSWTADSPLESPVHLVDLRAAPDYVGALAILGDPLEIVERDAGAILAAAT